MKNLAKVLFFAALTVSLFSSCNNQQWDPQTVPVDYYTAGFSGVGPAAHSLIYKNGEILYDLPGGYTIDCVEYANNSVYAGGFYFNGVTVTPLILKNGVPANTSLDEKCTYILDMISDGSNLLTCGSLIVGGSEYGVVLKGDSQIFKSTDMCEFKAIDLGASGDIYVVAQSAAAIKLLRIDRDDYTVKSTELIVEQTADEVYEAEDLFVGNRDISIALTSIRNGEHYACSWLSGELFNLSRNPAKALCTTFFNGYCITGGSMNESQPFAVQWYNLRAEDYSLGCNPNSSVNCVFNSGYYLHQAIQSDGQIQLCCNGALAYKINCDLDFNVSSMVVVNRK